MDFVTKEPDRWKRCWAWLPVRVGSNIVVFKHYWRMFMGDCFQVSLDAPRCDDCGGIAGDPVYCRHCIEVRDFYKGKL